MARYGWIKINLHSREDIPHSELYCEKQVSLENVTTSSCPNQIKDF